MLNLSSIARPYALAAFEYAEAENHLDDWKILIQSAAYVASQPEVQELFKNHTVTPNQLFDLFSQCLKPLLDSPKTNFLLLLAQNKRLAVLPAVANLFNIYYDRREKISDVRVVTANPLTETMQEKLIQALTARLKRQITLRSEIDPSILGGAIIHIGDRVIDGSIRGKLTRLLEFSLR